MCMNDSNDDFTIKITKPTLDEGRCEVCHDSMSTVIFDVGKVHHHHLCRECFERMMRTYAEKSNSVLVKNVEIKQKVSGHFEFN